ncbi:phosphoglycerate dehydrogenase [Thermodesulfovibrionales bacterium]|nr:phosphoglycerate dehydrogenase [Thermodesulfovibrionales bacterium]MCL0035176.1 phosphoglycerate dehydrogenase [Thermodesulfovibrionales bacterium]MCL0084747.1 phosphoglycerate dehydrogenase [Thermodesulfovibrionales bacterium]
MMKVLVSDSISSKGIEVLRKAGLEVDVKTDLKPDELKAIISDYHALIVRSATKATSEIIEAATNLKVIGRAGSGLDNIDKYAASKRGVVVMNTPDGNTITTAEHTIAMIFSIARKIPQASASIAQGKWEKKKFVGIELFNKTLSVIGIGSIGGEVARRAQALGMNVIAYDPFLSKDKAKAMGVEKLDFIEVIRRADFVTIHAPLTNETRNLIKRESLKEMKTGVFIINCARGGIVNEKDLYDALKSGKVAGAAMDVFEKEPPVDNPLVKHERVVCTPHLGASTKEAQENVAIAIAEQVVDYLIHETIRNAVNFPSIPIDQVAVLQPYITLAEKIGSFVSQIFEGEMAEVTLEYRGEVSKLNISPITIAALKGLLTPILHETVNFVNAPVIAKERRIEVKETKSTDAGDYQGIIAMRIKSPDGELQVDGTLFSKRDQRIVKIDNFTVEIVPEGNMLFMYNNDKPGVIGDIGALLGENNINIARMHFGRDKAGGLATSVVNIDSPVSGEIVEKIRNLPNILSVKVINL